MSNEGAPVPDVVTDRESPIGHPLTAREREHAAVAAELEYLRLHGEFPYQTVARANVAQPIAGTLLRSSSPLKRLPDGRYVNVSEFRLINIVYSSMDNYYVSAEWKSASPIQLSPRYPTKEEAQTWLDAWMEE